MNKNILLFLIILILSISKKNVEGYNERNICRGKLSDKDYLNHMIPHHQVAIDISYKLQEISKSPVMHDILRKLIWTQETEIKIMRMAIQSLPNFGYEDNSNAIRQYESTISDFIYPNKLGLTDTFCDPHFFKPEEHMKHMMHMKLDDKMYIEHMIPHHQVAVDMSKVLLKNTNNNFMRYLANRIIRSQQAEIVILDNILKKSSYKHNSKLLM